jgi:hypothetical protein
MVIREEESGDRFDSLELHDASATIDCRGSRVELEFDPEAGIEARVRGFTVAAADVTRRALNHGDCAETPTHRGWDTRLRYTTVATSTTLTCRFPGRFSVHVSSLSPSWAGERPAGSAVGLVLGRRVGPGTGPNRTIVASASVLERSDESELVYAPAYCTAS